MVKGWKCDGIFNDKLTEKNDIWVLIKILKKIRKIFELCKLEKPKLKNVNSKFFESKI